MYQTQKRQKYKAKKQERAEMYYHFEYSSGANPYIAKTETERDRVINRHKKAGELVKEIKPGFYVIEDSRKDGE